MEAFPTEDKAEYEEKDPEKKGRSREDDAIDFVFLLNGQDEEKDGDSKAIEEGRREATPNDVIKGEGIDDEKISESHRDNQKADG